MADTEEKKVQDQQQLQENTSPLDLNQEVFEEVVSRPVELSQLEEEVIIKFMDFRTPCQIKTCPGDIYKIVNALMDYSRLLEMVIAEWSLTGYHQVVYEFHANALRKIADKYSAGINYNYSEAVEKCRKKQERLKKKGDNSDVGEDALTLTVKRGQRKQENTQEQGQGQIEPEGIEDQD